MKKYLIILFCLFITMPTLAQNRSSQRLTFVYIAHDVNTDTQALVARLKELFKDTINYPDMRATIFYLANQSTPIVVKINMPGDNRKDFDEILYSLQNSRYHEIYPMEDVENIVQIFNENDILTDEGTRIYQGVDWIYYINSTFWERNNNEHVIAKLFFVMDMEQMIRTNYMTLDFYYGEKNDAIAYNRISPFGDKGICRSIEFMPLPY